jgi:uncharacterized protein (TIGR03435 family)
MRSRFFAIAAATASLIPFAFSQSASDPSAQFEAATIKPVDPRSGVNQGVNVYPGGRVVIHSVSLKTLISTAFHVGYWQLSGGDDWMEKDLYDVEAEAPHTPQAGVFGLRHTRFGIEDERLRQMLQTLLIESFQLKVHREIRTGSVYLLQKSGKTLRLRPTKFTSDKPVQGAPGYSGEIEFVGGHWFVFDTSVPQLAEFASNYILHRPILDQTEITGSFDYREPNAQIPQENDFEASFPSFIQDIGLKLTSAKGPVESLVIDHAEKPLPN